jgi:hypothetical protein
MLWPTGVSAFIRHLAIYALAMFGVDYAHAGPEAEPMVTVSSIAEGIKKIKNERSITQKTEYAYRLRLMFNKLPPDAIDDRTLSELAAMLEDRNDSVRFWIAASLGKIGPRARQTIPALENALKKVECAPGSLTSEPAIRAALAEIGKNPLPRVCPVGQ